MVSSTIYIFKSDTKGGTFVMDGFNTHFGWDTASQSQIDKETGLINGKLVSLMIRFDQVVYIANI